MARKKVLKKRGEWKEPDHMANLEQRKREKMADLKRGKTEAEKLRKAELASQQAANRTQV